MSKEQKLLQFIDGFKTLMDAREEIKDFKDRIIDLLSGLERKTDSKDVETAIRKIEGAVHIFFNEAFMEVERKISVIVSGVEFD